LARKIREYYGEGKRLGGHFRLDTTKEFGIIEGQADKVVKVGNGPTAMRKFDTQLRVKEDIWTKIS
jgi:hypothetical protein